MLNGSEEQYDREKHGTPIDFVIKKVADHQRVDPSELPILDQSIDDTLISRFLTHPPSVGELQFQWGDVIVTVTTNRTVRVRSARR